MDIELAVEPPWKLRARRSIVLFFRRRANSASAGQAVQRPRRPGTVARRFRAAAVIPTSSAQPTSSAVPGGACNPARPRSIRASAPARGRVITRRNSLQRADATIWRRERDGRTISTIEN